MSTRIIHWFRGDHPSLQGAFVGIPHEQQSHADGDLKGPDLLLHLRMRLRCWDVAFWRSSQNFVEKIRPSSGLSWWSILNGHIWSCDGWKFSGADQLRIQLVPRWKKNLADSGTRNSWWNSGHLLCTSRSSSGFFLGGRDGKGRQLMSGLQIFYRCWHRIL